MEDDMEDKLNALDKLIEAVEAGRWWDDRGIAAAACNRAGINNANAGRIGRALSGSLDAALALHEALLPEWHFDIASEANGKGHVVSVSDPAWCHMIFADAPTPARAWLLAVLKAYRSIQDDNR